MNIISSNLEILLSNEHLISLQIFIKFYMKMVELFNVKIIENWWGITCQKPRVSKTPVDHVTRFCERHRNQLRSLYLRSINHKRKTADNSQYFEYFYPDVSLR